MPIPPLPLFRHRDTVITPADQNQFVTQFENTMDTMSNDVIPAMNTSINDMNMQYNNIYNNLPFAPDSGYSQSYIDTNIYKKTETYNKTEVDTAISDATLDINNLSDKPTPDDTDNTVIQESDGTLKKLSWVNLKATLLTYFDTLYSRTTAIFGIGQTWQNMTSSRSNRVTYTNTTGKPIVFSIYNTLNPGIFYYEIDGIYRTGGGVNGCIGIVPNNSTYKITVVSGSIETWQELR